MHCHVTAHVMQLGEEGVSTKGVEAAGTRTSFLGFCGHMSRDMRRKYMEGGYTGVYRHEGPCGARAGSHVMQRTAANPFVGETRGLLRAAPARRGTGRCLERPRAVVAPAKPALSTKNSERVRLSGCCYHQETLLRALASPSNHFMWDVIRHR